MTYAFLTSQPAPTSPIPGGLIRPDYTAIVRRDDGRCAVVTISERQNEVRAGARACAPAYSDAAVDFVAVWVTEARARATLAHGEAMEREDAEVEAAIDAEEEHAEAQWAGWQFAEGWGPADFGPYGRQSGPVVYSGGYGSTAHYYTDEDVVATGPEGPFLGRRDGGGAK